MNITNLAERLSGALSDGLAGSLKPPAAHPVTLPDVLI